MRRFSYSKNLSFIFLLLFNFFATSLFAQNVYSIFVHDILRGVDSAAVTFGDSTKYTVNGSVLFFDPIVGVDDANVVPSSFAVSEPFSNPVKSDNVKFAFQNDKVSSIKFQLFDITGKLLSSGISRFNSGVFISKINGLSNLASGVYFIRVSRDNESYVKKFVNLNNGNRNYSRLRFEFSNGNNNINFLPKTKEDSYIILHIEKQGYLDYDENIDPSRTSISVDLEREGTTINGSVFDNVKYAFGNREPLEAKVKIFYNGNVKEQTGRVFDFQIPRNLQYLDSIKCVGVDEDTSFVLTYKNFPVDNDKIRLDFLVTTFDGLIYGYNVPDDSAVTVEQLELMAEEGIFRTGNYIYRGLKGPNVDNINNPIYENPDPTTDHGYEIVIPTHQMSDIDPNSGPFTQEQQQQLKEIIENDIETKYPEGKRMRVRVLTENDTLPIFWSSEGYPRPYPGVSIVSRGTGGFTYGFGAFDYNSDGWTDASYITVGTDFAVNLPGTRQELHSIYITMPLEPTFIPGDVNQRSIFLQSGYKSYDFTTTVDNKLVNGILMNMHEDLMTSYDNNGEERIRVNYIPKKAQREILGQ